MQETRVRSLGWEGLLEKGMATHSSILAWRIPWTEDLLGYSPWGHKESDTTVPLTFLSFLSSQGTCMLHTETRTRSFPSSWSHCAGPSPRAPPWAFLQHLGLGQFQALGLE